MYNVSVCGLFYHHSIIFFCHQYLQPSDFPVFKPMKSICPSSTIQPSEAVLGLG